MDSEHEEGAGAPEDAAAAGARRWWFALLAYAFLGIGLVGVVVPGLPTVPFLLLAAWAAGRGSRRLHDWLHAHPRFGPSLVQWREERAVSTGSKAFALTLLAVSWAAMAWREVDVRVLAPVTVLFAGVALFLVTRPPPRERSGSGNGKSRPDLCGGGGMS